ncbi:MAG: phosphoglycerate dehydrogenase [Candidatus Marinimicrobia bacterium]|jgi:D-3-phosphoglycerate dehydrogenase|nr:phosphoglycerate dehydrogenase [Candidatus Neomarinimicrobiota bacterium]MBT3675082.1 phosphoglycerate dehydrogenase [Candidatus Neomarinimicrobiota bacterium]MBT3763905.1 phosphoglycerate dehydrogenase [Candidatus Neomarinimicrobiota bacterium]MBT4067546.1 phosphoglycerate dehydrogenase [Candidatus Neomarinimicrobiota bacterium]MBT4372725.1 phosphoglycerate dehydrogenase [Candidatus Neomarinimicrobiota bacterium]
MKILVSDPITESGMAVLTDANFDVVQLPEGTPEEKAEACKDIHGWVIRSGTKITAEMIDGAENLQVIGRAGVGVDNIDIPAATRRGVVVMNTPDVNTISAAEHTVAIMLTLSRNISIGDSGMKNGEWNRNALVGTELRHKTLGIVGMGKIGREVMTRCRSFGMKILGFDPYMNQDMFNPEEVTIVDLDELTANSDYITVHVPLTDSTRDLFDYARLSAMKSTARIVNVARGGIINEAGLAKALVDGKIAGAAIDVFTSEPVDDSNPLVNAPNIVLTPHLGASTKEAKEGVSMAVCEQVRDYLLHEKLNNALNMPISDMAKLKEIQINLDLAELMGILQGQLNPGVIKRVQVECSGTMDEAKPAALAFLKGLLKNRIPDRVNYINAESLAVELGISIEHSFTNDSGSYTNLIRTRVTGESEPTRIAGSVFEGNRIRMVNILGYEMEVTPYGTMLFARNKDVPGVIGKVGTMLGEAKVNIGGYLLSREMNDGEAFAVVRVDNPVPDSVLSQIRDLPEIISVQQLHC